MKSLRRNSWWIWLLIPTIGLLSCAGPAQERSTDRQDSMAASEPETAGGAPDTERPVHTLDWAAANIQYPARPDDDFVPEVHSASDDGEAKKYIYRARYFSAAALQKMLASIYEDEDDPPKVFAQEDPEDDLPFAEMKERIDDLVIVATPAQYAEVLDMLEKIDRKPLQAYLDVIVAEYELSNEESMGLQGDVWFAGEANLLGSIQPFDSSAYTSFSDIGSERSEGFNYTLSVPSMFEMRLRMLAKEGRLRVLSTPNILVEDDRQAKLTIGQTLPIRVTKYDSNDRVSEEIDEKEVNLELDVTPKINPDGTVRLKVLQKAEEIAIENYNQTGAALVNKREAQTILMIRDTQSVVLGGLITEREQQSEVGVPILRNIPLLGRLFRHTSTKIARRELVLFITCHVMWTPAHEAAYLNGVHHAVQPWKDADPFVQTDSQRFDQQLRRLRRP